MAELKPQAQLKPCPFCGGFAQMQYYVYDASEVVCSECFAKGATCCGRGNEERAIEAWNRRAEDDK